MAVYENQIFTKETINVDDKTYAKCTFLNCEIVYSGGGLPTLTNNIFTECTFTMDGPARRTLIYLKGLYGGGGADIVEEVIASVRDKNGLQ